MNQKPWLLDEHKSRVITSEIKYLQRLKKETRKDRIRNKTIIKRLKMWSIVEKRERERTFKICSPN